ncbi:hypothetical protein A3C23_00330 [Candidatus Roizmanbacteria bacterium RIFCSPHIGHO2_02_FULL_37_13b]|uniref:Uncharacterized protein n=1 Tax=Candidatus Roizmanbacteria bacterium RIFCSPLOWO2_02_FULL_36_11 TaxID=1802071 RepID=A0A1F7JBF6_9BACT|nr:MAG: hypothetical protein A3C23_00330 [Candidatus Roizmanbacteria bacterium RIFCSPHIGHO2_02_FULL_37_13b]OGK52949.1 MAG: hypothetical protein A3H78_02440 [Candidatus Roizmanbacteria bacterium RIFCSPLOWO2_02_FULL_36_11]
MFDLKLIIKSIVEHQQAVIGPLAIEQANKVPGIKVDDGVDLKVNVTGDNTSKILDELVKKYEVLFGQASVEVCKDAIKEIKSKVDIDKLPQILQ